MSFEKKKFFWGILLISTFLPLFSFSATLGEEVVFNIDRSYDWKTRQEVTAVLVKITSNFYFYADKDWWEQFGYFEKKDFEKVFYKLDQEFENKIYPTLISYFGKEPRPGIDKDNKITILLHPMRKEKGGYFSNGNLYPKIIYPKSNEREMIYLNSRYADDFDKIKVFLAHEFTHLIVSNQKELLRNVNEETWLNEARAEYSATLLGYDDDFNNSNLKQRVEDFLKNKNDSLTEWLNEKADYAVINLFIQYLVDHYGIQILTDSLKSSEVGIPSLNYALKKNGFEEDFSQIFTDWLITLFINDCDISPKYCYLNKNLRDFKIVPTLYYLPPGPESVLTVYTNTKEWAGNWQKIIGGKGTLIFEFDGKKEEGFKVPYLLCDYQGECEISFLDLDENQKGKIEIKEFGTRYAYLVIIPSIQAKTSGFDGKEEFYSFSWTASLYEKTPEEKESELIQRLLAQIEELKKQIAYYQAKINEILAKRGKGLCGKFEKNLYYGLINNLEVRCLQQFLKSQGPEIYPEGLVTGNFLELTYLAVIRFQEKYKDEILAPLGLEKGTGFVGPLTRAKINQLLNF